MCELALGGIFYIIRSSFLSTTFQHVNLDLEEGKLSEMMISVANTEKIDSFVCFVIGSRKKNSIYFGGKKFSIC